MAENKNTIQIKHGEGAPGVGVLAPYELGYNSSDGILYIGQEGAVGIAITVPPTRTINNKALSSNITLSASDVGALPINGGTVSGNIYTSGTAETQIGVNFNGGTLYLWGDNSSGTRGLYDSKKGNYVIQCANTSNNTYTFYGIASECVPLTRKINNKALSSDITLTASDVGARPSTWMPTAANVGAVPTSRTVNGKALSSNISLSASDVNARPSSWTPTYSDVGAAPSSHNHSTSNITSGTFPMARLPMAWKKTEVDFRNGALQSVTATGATTASAVLATRGDGSMNGSTYYSLGAADCNSAGTIKVAQNVAINDKWIVSFWWSIQ